MAWVGGRFAVALLGLAVLFGPTQGHSELTERALLPFLLAAGVLFERLWRRLRVPLAAEAQPARDRLGLELALHLAVSAELGLALSGGASSPFAPLLYLGVAALVAAHRPAVAIGGVALLLSVDLIAAWRSGALLHAQAEIGARGGFITLFGVSYHLALHALTQRSRGRAEATVQAHVDDLHQRAREYRLIVGEGGGEGGPSREKWLVAAVDEVEGSVQAVLEVASKSLGAHTVAAYLLSEDEQRLRLVECFSDAASVRLGSLPAGEGLVGVVARRGRAVRLNGTFRGLTYYEAPPKIGAFMGVPLLERGPSGEAHIRGVLLVDRQRELAFTAHEEQVLEGFARQVLRAIQIERVMGYIRREKEEKATFFSAIERLNRLSKPDEIAAEVVRDAQALAGLDLVALTFCGGPEGAAHSVAAAVGEGSEGLVGGRFPENSGLVASVARLGAPLPGRAFHEMSRPVVFGDGLPLPGGLCSLKVLPLAVGDEVLGTLVCGAKAKRAIGAEALRLLEVLATQAAGAVERGRLFEQTERMATTDGLTGLNNHRRFQELFDSHLAASRRYGRPVSLLLTDVDHFKSVNDTYGHPVGDQVLRGVAQVLQGQARDTDVVARYGGEEFAVVLPETGPEGAVVIAERIRRAIEAEVFQTELGELRVTISLGVATCPEHGDHKQHLVERCDQALYAAKRSGRNRVVVTGPTG